MATPDDRDERIRKLLSGLPRMQAPPGFEERLARRIARGRTRPAILPVRLRAFTVPALSLLLVGVLSYAVYLTQFRTAGDSPRPESDTVPVPGTVSSSEPAPSTGGQQQDLPPAVRTDGFRSEDALAGKSRPVTIRPVEDAPFMKKGVPLEGLATPRRFFPSGPAGFMNAGRTAPGRMMMEPEFSDSSSQADSPTGRDTSAPDSVPARPDTLRDSTRGPETPEAE